MRYNKENILKILNLPLNDLIFKAQGVHRKSFKKADVQLASLVSIKTGSQSLRTASIAHNLHILMLILKEKLINFQILKLHNYCKEKWCREILHRVFLEKIKRWAST